MLKPVGVVYLGSWDCIGEVHGPLGELQSRLLSRKRLERPAREGESPVGEKEMVSLGVDPE